MAALHPPGLRKGLARCGNRFSAAALPNGADPGTVELLSAFGAVLSANGPGHPFAEGKFRITPPPDEGEKKRDDGQSQDQVHDSRCLGRPAFKINGRVSGRGDFPVNLEGAVGGRMDRTSTSGRIRRKLCQDFIDGLVDGPDGFLRI